MDISSLVPLPGGWSGETFLAEVGGERSVVRIYSGASDRGAAAAEVDAALLRLVRGLLPVPEVLELRPDDRAANRPAVLVTSLLPGRRADELLPGLGSNGRAQLGATLGDLVADLGGMPMLSPGPFVDGELRIGSFGDLDGLPAYVEAREPDLAHFAPDELSGLREISIHAQALLDTVSRTCLVHSDLNPKNLLVDPDSLELTGVLDWEYAHAGHPFTDLGNLLRFERDTAFTSVVLARYAERRGVPADRALDLARAADLWALVELAARRHANPVASRADALLRGIARRRDPGHSLPD